MAHASSICWMVVSIILLANQKHFMKRLCILFFFCGYSIALAAQENKFNLQQCIDSALHNNIPVLQAGLQKQSAELNKQQAKYNLLPSLNGRLNYAFNFGRNVDPITNTFTNNELASSNAGLDANVVLFNGMRLRNLIQQTNLNYQAANFDEQQAKNNLALNVILAYMQVLNNEDLLAVSKAQLLVTEKQVERIEVLVKEGAVGNFQLSDIKGQKVNEEINIINLQNSIAQSKLSLCQLMNCAFNPNMQLDREGLELKTDMYALTALQVADLAMQQMPLVQANQMKIQSATKNIKIAQSGFYPTVSFNGSMGSSYSSLSNRLIPTSIVEVTTGDYIKTGTTRTPVYQEVQNYKQEKVGYGTQMDNNLGYFAGVNLQIPIFNSFQTKNRVKLANINLQNVKLDAANTNYQLQQNIQQAWLNMQTTFKRLDLLNQQLNHFEQSFKAAEVRFTNGAINANEFLIVKNNLDRTKINLVQAKYEYSFRTKLLDFYQGKAL